MLMEALPYRLVFRFNWTEPSEGAATSQFADLPYSVETATLTKGL